MTLPVACKRKISSSIKQFPSGVARVSPEQSKVASLDRARPTQDHKDMGQLAYLLVRQTSFSIAHAQTNSFASVLVVSLGWKQDGGCSPQNGRKQVKIHDAIRCARVLEDVRAR